MKDPRKGPQTNGGDVGYTSTLTINGTDKFDVLQFGVSFSRDYDAKGRPSSAVRAGELRLVIETTGEAKVINVMPLANAIKGTVEFWQSGKDDLFRKIEFENAYLTSYKQSFQPSGASGLPVAITITAEKITIGSARYDARWPKNS